MDFLSIFVCHPPAFTAVHDIVAFIIGGNLNILLGNADGDAIPLQTASPGGVSLVIAKVTDGLYETEITFLIESSNNHNIPPVPHPDQILTLKKGETISLFVTQVATDKDDATISFVQNSFSTDDPAIAHAVLDTNRLSVLGLRAGSTFVRGRVTDGVNEVELSISVHAVEP